MVYVCIHTHTHTHTQEYCSAIKKDEISPFATIWVGTVLSEISDGERQILYDFTYMWNIKYKQTK